MVKYLSGLLSALVHGDSKKVESIVPNKPVPRPACPFYGFSGLGIMIGAPLMDSRGNQCALQVESHSPCLMLIRGDKPDWAWCELNAQVDGDQLPEITERLESLRFTPDEFWPVGERSWKGLSWAEWYDYVMNRAPRPQPLQRAESGE
jgi:hypothetical protein